MRRRLLTAAGVSLILALATAGAVQRSTAAWIGSTTNPTTGATALTLTNATAGGASTANVDCNPVTLTWTKASAPVNDYRIERRINAGAWATLLSSTGDVATYNDTTGYSNQTVEWRVISRYSSNWEGATPAQTASLRCGVADLAVSNPCSSSVLTWSAAAAATTYDVESSTTGGAPWTVLATDVAATTYTDATQYTNGANVTYRVRPGIGAGGDATNYSNLATQNNWQDFRVLSVTANDVTTLGTVTTGDNLVVVFSKPVATASVTTGTQVGMGKGANKEMSIAGPFATPQIGTVDMSSNQFGSSNTPTGTPVWSSGDTVWTWTWAATGNTHTTTLNAAGNTFTPSTVVRCGLDTSAAGQLKNATAPTLAGRF